MVVIKMFLIILCVCLFSGCHNAYYYTIDTNKILLPPSDSNVEFIPVAASGSETITKGTDKTVVTSEFITNVTEINSMKGISISKNDVKVTVAQATFDYMKKNYGLYTEQKHPLANLYYPTLYLIYSRNAYYNVNNTEPYQYYNDIPFNPCIMKMFRNNPNQLILNKFQEAFSAGAITALYGNDKRTPNEIRSEMEWTIGQPYCSSYFKSNIVFYVRVENLGKEKIRLWPISQSVIVDENNSQYKALHTTQVDKELSSWKSKLDNLPDGRENSQLGLRLVKVPDKTKSYETYTYYENGLNVNALDNNMPGSIAGILIGDKLIKLDDKIVDSISDVTNFLSIKRPGEQIKATMIRGGKTIEKILILKSDYDMPRPSKVKILSEGNVYPNVIYDGFIIFNTESMLNNYKKGATIKLIVPLIGTRFDAADLPVRSYDYEFTFKLDEL